MAKVTGITVEPDTLEMTSAAGQNTYQLTANVEAEETPVGGISADKTVAWTSSDESVAIVHHRLGLVTAKGDGTATITASTGGGEFTDTCEVAVSTQTPSPVAVEGIAVSPENVSLYSNHGPSTAQLTATVTPENATNKGVTWSTDDSSVATVSPISGLVTVHGAGNATITATTRDNGHTATCTVTVSTYTAPSGGSSGGSNTTTTTEKNEDGSITKTETNKATGTVTETTTFPNGDKTVVETKKDGTVTETVTQKDGTKSETVTKPDGSLTQSVTTAEGVKTETKQDAEGNITADVTIPKKAVENGKTVTLPIPAVDAAKENTVTVTAAKDAEVQVEVPVKGVTAGTVAVIVNEDGTGTIVKTSIPTESGLALTVEGEVTVKIVDNSKDFADVANEHWAAEAVAFVTSRELFNGIGEDTFGPAETTSRAMLFTVLARLEGVETEGGETWYEKAMAWSVEAGVSDGTLPEASITREQLATMLYRYAGQPAAEGGGKTFTDSDQVSDWAAQAMDWAVKTGILTGKDGDRLDPTGTATRVEVATMLMRFVHLMAK